jgi:hypothetical protein
MDCGSPGPCSLEHELKIIRNLSGNDLLARYQELLPSQLPDHDFFISLTAWKTEMVYKCCLLLYTTTVGKKLPCKFQLEATLALLSGRDCLINAGTGSGKTLCMVLPALLNPSSVSLVISPLK